MAVINIEIVSVGKPETIPTKNGKSYQTVEVAYKKDGKIEGKKIMSFVNPSVFKEVQKFNAGDKVSIEIEKDEKGYWQWRGFVSQQEEAKSESSSTPSTKTVSNYETREERQQRQQFIIRQSSISSAIEYLKDTEAGVEDILSTAEQFVNYVNNGIPKTAIQELEDMQNDIPY